MTVTAPPQVRFGTSTARWTIAATVLGSGMAFLDGTVVNVALPSISDDLGTSVMGLQWIVNAYLVTLSALLLLGGSLGDRYGHRTVFVTGAAVFTAASVLCGIAPTSGFLIAARTLQGVGGAMLVPGSLAIIAATFHPDDRGRAIGAWSGLAGVASSFGPFLGGWLIDSVSWRLVFLINIPACSGDDLDLDPARARNALVAARPDRHPRRGIDHRGAGRHLVCRDRPRQQRRDRSPPSWARSRSSPSSSSSIAARTRCCRCGCSAHRSSPGPT